MATLNFKQTLNVRNNETLTVKHLWDSSIDYLNFLINVTYVFVFFNLPTPCILVVSHFFLFRINAHNILNTYIYHQSPPTCFGVCYTIFRDTIEFLAQKLLYAFFKKIYILNTYLTYYVHLAQKLLFLKKAYNSF